MNYPIQLANSAINILSVGLVGIIALGLLVLIINVVIVLAFITFAAKKNSEMFDYDQLAEKIADQMIRKQVEYDRYKQKERVKKYKISQKKAEEDKHKYSSSF